MTRFSFGFLAGVVFSVTLLLDGRSTLPQDWSGWAMALAFIGSSVVVFAATTYLYINLKPSSALHSYDRMEAWEREHRPAHRRYTGRHIRTEPAETGLASVYGYGPRAIDATRRQEVDYDDASDQAWWDKPTVHRQGFHPPWERIDSPPTL